MMADTRARVLVVEDDPAMAEDIRLRLGALGYDVIGPVGSAAAALQAVVADLPDLVLMDVVLPGDMDGVTAAAHMQQRDIPVVYLTAHADDALLERARITEPCGYLVKPYTDRELHATMMLALYRHRVKRQQAQAQIELERKVEERTAHLVELNQRLLAEATERAQVERALRESERLLRQIIDLVPHRIFVKDDESRFLLVNRTTAAVYGLTAEAMTGRRQQDLHGEPQELARILADDRAVIESSRPKLDFEETFTSADGVQRILRTSKIPFQLSDGQRRAVLGMAMDITEQKRSEQRLIASELKFRVLLENAVDAILLADLQGNIIDANRRAETLLGYTREELRGMNAQALHPPYEHARVREVFRELARSGNSLAQHPVLRKDGILLQVEVAATLVHFGVQSVAQGIFRDVTERERRSKDRLEQEQRHRETLVREVHHRIKNNLQGVVGLLREHANAHPELADVISSAIGQVQSISVVHGLHGQGDDLQVRLCDMVQAIARNASTLTRAAVEPEVQLAIERPVQVNQDEAVPVALIINELILNAVKHGADGTGAKRVAVRLTQADRHAEVCVVNPGRLPEDFEFARGRGSGTGLGLVRSLLPHAGASLDLEQAPGEVHARLRLGPPVIVV